MSNVSIKAASVELVGSAVGIGHNATALKHILEALQKFLERRASSLFIGVAGFFELELRDARKRRLAVGRVDAEHGNQR